MVENDDRDEIRHWLAGPIANAPNNLTLRDAVIQRSVAVLRRQRQLKRVGIAAALVSCYLGGMLTMSLVRNVNSSATVVTAAAPLAPSSPREPQRDNAVLPAELHEPALPEIKLTPYDRLRKLGDRQLADETDIPGAIRTYRKALQVASADEMTLSLDHDTWLLMALKTDHSNP